MIKKAIQKVWIFSSKSSDKTYETLKYADGTTSCNCMGWTRHVKLDGSRSCSHTRSVDMGRADIESIDRHTYTDEIEEPKPVKKVQPKKVNKPKSKVSISDISRERKIVW